jgi:isoquinoline 1-oxidoreductase beta subunit
MNTEKSPSVLDRRSFLKLTAAGSGGLILALYLRSDGTVRASDSNAAAGPEGDFAPNLFVRIGQDGTVTIVAHKPEMGQGIRTALPMVLAEELDVAWESVRIEAALYDQAYGSQSAGGSRSTPTSYDPMRRLGATARAMLVEAAAQTWGVRAAELTTESGTVIHAASGRRAGYGELVARASTLPVPDANTIALKNPRDFRIIGTRQTGYQNPQVVTGQPLFGVDQKIPGMRYAVYQKSPVFGGRVRSANLEEIRRLPGVRDAFVLEGTDNLTGLMPGVAIVADSTWAAFSARRQLQVTWDEGAHASDNSAEFDRRAREIGARNTGEQNVRTEGDVDAALASAARTVEATYSYPFISHTNLEPQNCTAWVQGDRVEIWAPTQNPGAGAGLITSALGIPAANIKITITRSGGGFGRRLSGDYMVEAAAISERAGVPIKLTWDRTDDLQHDHFRPGGYHFLKGGVDASGRLVAWHNHFVTFAVNGRPGSGGSLDAGQFPARFVPHYRTVQSAIDCSIPMGPWRAPGNCAFGFVMQGFIDELAHVAGRDPYQFRLELLGDRDMVSDPPGAGRGGRGGGGYDASRARGVMTLAAERAGWGRQLPRGQGQGIAFHFSHQGYVAQVAEVTVSRSGELRVDRVVCAADVGRQIVNLSGAENQVEGSIVDGLGTALYQDLTLENGRIVQANLDAYPMIRMPMAPVRIETHFLTSDNDPTGLGEPVIPPVAAAVANAIFAATGKRLREFPFSKTDLSWS